MNIIKIGVIITIVLFAIFWQISELNKQNYNDKIKFANDCREKGNNPKILDAYGYKYGILICAHE